MRVQLLLGALRFDPGLIEGEIPSPRGTILTGDTTIVLSPFGTKGAPTRLLTLAALLSTSPLAQHK